MAAPQPEEGASELDTRAPVSLYIAAPDFPHDRSSVREAEAPRRAPILPHSRAERPSLRFALLAPFIRSRSDRPRIAHPDQLAKSTRVLVNAFLSRNSSCITPGSGMRLAPRARQPERDPRPAPRPAVFRNLPTTRAATKPRSQFRLNKRDPISPSIDEGQRPSISLKSYRISTASRLRPRK